MKMHLEKLQNFLRSAGWRFRYAEEDGLGSVDFEHRGLTYHVWEFSGGAETNIRTAGRQEDVFGDYEDKIIAQLQSWL